MPNIKIIQWNSNGITKKQNELQAFVSKNNIDIILLCETKLSPFSNLNVRNFHTYRNDLSPKHGSPAHGGTAVLVHRNIVYQPTNLNTSIQSSSIKVQIGNNEVLVTSIYKPPNSSLTGSDLDKLTQSADWFISEDDYNAKHHM